MPGHDDDLRKAQDIEKQKPGFYEFYKYWKKHHQLDVNSLVGGLALAGLMTVGESTLRDAQLRHDVRVIRDELKKR